MFRILMIISCINNGALEIEKRVEKFASFALSMCENCHSFLILLVSRLAANDGGARQSWRLEFCSGISASNGILEKYRKNDINLNFPLKFS